MTLPFVFSFPTFSSSFVFHDHKNSMVQEIEVWCLKKNKWFLSGMRLERKGLLRCQEMIFFYFFVFSCYSPAGFLFVSLVCYSPVNPLNHSLEVLNGSTAAVSLFPCFVQKREKKDDGRCSWSQMDSLVLCLVSAPFHSRSSLSFLHHIIIIFPSDPVCITIQMIMAGTLNYMTPDIKRFQVKKGVKKTKASKAQDQSPSKDKKIYIKSSLDPLSFSVPAWNLLYCLNYRDWRLGWWWKLLFLSDMKTCFIKTSSAVDTKGSSVAFAESPRVSWRHLFLPETDVLLSSFSTPFVAVVFLPQGFVYFICQQMRNMTLILMSNA